MHAMNNFLKTSVFRLEMHLNVLFVMMHTQYFLLNAFFRLALTFLINTYLEDL